MKKITLFILVIVFGFSNAQTLEGTWKMSPQAGAFGVGPNQGDTSWFANSLADVTTRACFFDDEYVFNANGTFTTVLGSQSWIEGWQGGTDTCGTPVAPHNGSNAATWTHNTTNGTVTLNGVGAFLGLAKAYNGGELSSPGAAPASITYTITSLTSNLLTLDIFIGGGWWRFVLAKQGVAPTCTDGIQNGTETGVDCGGTCTACLTQINLPINFEGNTINYTVTDFGGNASSKVADPLNASNTVIKTIKTTGAELWAGTTMSTPSGFSSVIPFTLTNRKVYVRVYSPDVGIPVRLKVEETSNATHSCETQTNTTVVGWQTMEFDFNNQASGTAAFNQSYQFNMMSIFFNFGTTGAIAGEKIYYFDDVNYASPLSIASFDPSKINVYPNPVSSILTIESVDVIDSINIFNTLGQEVMNFDGNEAKKEINVSNLSNGIYIVKAVISGKISISKFIKE
ncbi:T9SS type A sorting domain-containing protein [uncultured Flavobacterium sp.]|uniref:T9SS type A sorting domain-containing protein n=1 Tax=uncultured Flavobacterium sp. TaxID=165435 RepID=UPI0025927BC1|nr:T9SS type A sorting domain-containing protein [uncultured Flavobacterium sp.]